MTARRRQRGRPAALAVLAAVTALAAAAVRESVASAAPNPTSNIPIGQLPSACAGSPAGPACENAVVAALDAARHDLGLAAYRLPAGFVGMPAPHQWLILANLDRAAYSLPAIAGTAAALNHVARAGAVAHQDPDPWPLLQSLQGQRLIGFSSNWAGGQPNALVAYYGWMYDDGYGSGNLDCRSPADSGCWGHRQDILAFAHAPALTMGAAALTRAATYALTIVETSTPPWPYAYRWQH
jgi:hypothetical protein